MLLMMFAVACGADSPPPADTGDSRPLDNADETGDEEEAAKSSDSGGFNFDSITLDDWLEVGEPDGASFRGSSSIDMDNLKSASDN